MNNELYDEKTVISPVTFLGLTYETFEHLMEAFANFLEEAAKAIDKNKEALENCKDEYREQKDIVDKNVKTVNKQANFIHFFLFFFTSYSHLCPNRHYFFLFFLLHSYLLLPQPQAQKS